MPLSTGGYSLFGLYKRDYWNWIETLEPYIPNNKWVLFIKEKGFTSEEFCSLQMNALIPNVNASVLVVSQEKWYKHKHELHSMPDLPPPPHSWHPYAPYMHPLLPPIFWIFITQGIIISPISDCKMLFKIDILQCIVYIIVYCTVLRTVQQKQFCTRTIICYMSRENWYTNFEH